MSEWPVKDIRFGDVRVGDSVSNYADSSVVIRDITGPYPSYNMVELHHSGGTIPGGPDSLIGLVRRPWPEGKSEADMLQIVVSAIRDATRVGTLPPGKTFDLTIHQCRIELDPFRDGDALRTVREAIENWELGKPIELQRNESLVDRHMAP